ncbi:hypothetical protein GQ53DRAFT_885727 [Thozetella sp. PMI_491]|nr:hypothetical protein GQ53DRAFT_885727 [Thozetella sp. PMI_491]
MPPTRAFPQFSHLPGELQLMIWEAASTSPSMHVFDVCFPSRGTPRAWNAFARGVARGELSASRLARYAKFRQSVFLDALEAGGRGPAQPSPVAYHQVDPSMYTFHRSLKATCTDSFRALELEGQTTEINVHTSDINTVYLPGPDRRVWYNNGTDILHLRFGQKDGADESTEDDLPELVALKDNLADAPPPGVLDLPDDQLSDLTAILESTWSPEMADTLRTARRVAFDASAAYTHFTTGISLIEEVIFLACTIQQDLEVLYLVDYCIGRCKSCNKGRLDAADLQGRGGVLDLDLHGAEDVERKPEMIQGVGKVYKEVFEFEKMGWNAAHPTFLFARVLAEAIRDQQAEASLDGKVIFQGVRVLMAEDQHIEGLDTSVLVDCGNMEEALSNGIERGHKHANL